MLPSWANEAVTLVPVVWVEERGKKVRSYPGPGVTIMGCSVQPGNSSSDRIFRDGVTIRHTVFMPPTTAVDRFTKVLVGGRAFRVEGDPDVWKSPTGTVSHIVVFLVDWEG